MSLKKKDHTLRHNLLSLTSIVYLSHNRISFIFNLFFNLFQSTEPSLKSTLISSLSTSISIEEIPSNLLTLFSTLPAQQLHVIPSTFNVSFIIHNLLINFYLYTTIPLYRMSNSNFIY